MDKTTPIISNKQISITNRPSLIDINQQLVNFYLEFEMTAIDKSNETSKSSVPFQVSIVTQKQIDETDIEKIPLRSVVGQVSGNLRIEQNKYDNYFFILCSTTPIPVIVDISTKVTPLPLSSLSSSSINTIQQTEQQDDIKSTCLCPIRKWFGVEKWTDLLYCVKFWISVVILAVVLYGIYLFFFNTPQYTSEYVDDSCSGNDPVMNPIYSNQVGSADLLEHGKRFEDVEQLEDVEYVQSSSSQMHGHDNDDETKSTISHSTIISEENSPFCQAMKRFCPE